MADPVSLSLLAAGGAASAGAGGAAGIASVGMAASAVGGIIGGIGSIFTGQSQSRMAKYQAGIARQQAMIAKQDANYAEAVGGLEVEQVGLRNRTMVGSTRAAIGAGNIDINTGSASKVISSELAVGQESEKIVQANAAKRAFGFQVAAAGDLAQASIYDASAKTAEVAGGIGAVTSILGGVGQVSDQYLKARQSGIFSG